MSAVRTAFVWIAFGVVCGILALISILFTRLYTKRYERDAFVTIVSIFSMSVVLATACLLPVDIAIVSQTTTDVAQQLTRSETAVKVVYYLLYSMDAFLILLLIPFTYFWFEEWDEESTTGGRIRGALKFSIIFIVIAITLLILGLFIPYGRGVRDNEYYFIYFQQLLMENRGERALTFIIGVLLCLGIIVYVIYTAIGFAVLPILCMKYRPSLSVAELDDTRVALQLNREKQRMIEARYEGTRIQWSTRDKRAYEVLQREEKTLIRKVRVNAGNPKWYKPRWLVRSFRFVARPVVMIIGFFLMIIALLIVASILISMVDHIKNTPCGRHCGFLLPATNIINPINEFLRIASRGFPADYIVTLFIIVWLFISTVIGLSYFSIRLVWFVLFRIQRGKTDPQGLLLGTAMIMVAVLAINYSFTMVIAPDYARYGSQQFCNYVVDGLYGMAGMCEDHPEELVSCAEASRMLFTTEFPAFDPGYILEPDATSLVTANYTVYFNSVCRQTLVSTFIDRISVNFPWFGLWSFWGQFGFVGIFLIAIVVAIIRKPSWDTYDADDDDDPFAPEEEQGLLSRTAAKWSNRVNTTWDDLRTRARLADQAAQVYRAVS
ncbi:hypothetical protein BZA70DRAFT_271004 [Myxozyma melibiosi]|uniref:Probable lysosomal cobalamin transporter n=1 Tax=Myxozyma melibiosi TaxID=54550 RepID=A0ABR1FBU3_9ASCO